MPYRIRISAEAKNVLREMPGYVRQRAAQMIKALAQKPRPAGTKELRGHPGIFRLRLDHWRIIYRVDDVNLLVSVIGIRRKAGPETYHNVE